MDSIVFPYGLSQKMIIVCKFFLLLIASDGAIFWFEAKIDLEKCPATFSSDFVATILQHWYRISLQQKEKNIAFYFRLS